MNSIYIESSQINEVLISNTTDINLGSLVSIDGLKVIKSGGLTLTDNLFRDTAIKINNEVKRVDYVEDDNTFYVTREFKDTHVATDVIYKDFATNIATTVTPSGAAYKIETDNYENQVAISELIGGVLLINKCTELTNANSLFIFDDATNRSERQESMITGTYDLTEDNYSNVVNPFLAKIGRQIYFIVDMEEDIVDLSSSGTGTISGLNSNIYSIRLNGKFLENTDYTIAGGSITVTNTSLLRGNTDYITVLHYPSQENRVVNNSVSIRLGFFNYDKLFMLDDIELADLNTFCLRTDMSSNIQYEFYDVASRSIKQTQKEKVGINSRLTITTRVAEDLGDDKLIKRHLQYYLSNLDKFRIIRQVEDSGVYEYHNSARLIEGSSYTEGDVNVYTYNIEFLQRVTLNPNVWGDQKWGDFYWGVDKTALE